MILQNYYTPLTKQQCPTCYAIREYDDIEECFECDFDGIISQEWPQVISDIIIVYVCDVENISKNDLTSFARCYYKKEIANAIFTLTINLIYIEFTLSCKLCKIQSFTVLSNRKYHKCNNQVREQTFGDIIMLKKNKRGKCRTEERLIGGECVDCRFIMHRNGLGWLWW